MKSKIQVLIVTLVFAITMWAQNAAPTAPADHSQHQAKASCCKDGASCCKEGASCCGKESAEGCCKDGKCSKEGAANMSCCKGGAKSCAKMAKADSKDAKGCCGGKMCQRNKPAKS
ncbi:MAG TPA: hypothetical protein VN577_17160 [Terriglobales bacterium]|nr:hypothetical protein [Terriglobales bacterium]